MDQRFIIAPEPRNQKKKKKETRCHSFNPSPFTPYDFFWIRHDQTSKKLIAAKVIWTRLVPSTCLHGFGRGLQSPISLSGTTQFVVTEKKWLPFFSLWCSQRKVIQGPTISQKPPLPPPPLPSHQTHPQASNLTNLSVTNIPASTKVKGMVLVGEEQM